jgi:predicted phage terminase large subunit-like protein
MARQLLQRLRRVLARLRLKRALAGGVLAFASLFLAHHLGDALAPYHHELGAALDHALQPGHRLIGALPREHGKTTLGTVATALSAVCLERKRNILLVSANRQEAQAKLRLIITELETNPLMTAAFGSAVSPARDSYGRYVAYSDSEAVLAGGARLCAIGWRGKVRGQLAGGNRLDLVILDDPEDDRSVASWAQRAAGRAWADCALLNALDARAGSLVWLGTLLHHDSVLAQWLAEHEDNPDNGVMKWGGPLCPPCEVDSKALVGRDARPTTTAVYPTENVDSPWRTLRHAAIDEDGAPLWPGRWTRELLAQRQAEIGDRAFAQEYLNDPVSLAGQIFRDTDFRYYDPAQLSLADGQWRIGGLPLVVTIGVDPAIGADSLADWFAACVVGVRIDEDGDEGARIDPGGAGVPARDWLAGTAARLTNTEIHIALPLSPRVYVLDMVRERLRFAEQLEVLERLALAYQPARIGIESVAYQAALSQAALDRGLPVVAQNETRGKRVRIEAVGVHSARGGVLLPTIAPWTAAFRAEAGDYPSGRHDDQLDAFARAVELALPLARGAGGISVAETQRTSWLDLAEKQDGNVKYKQF